jgi:hypothetical protein
MTKDDLPAIVEAALHSLGGKGTLLEVAKHIWKHHESDLRSSGDLFFTWQHDMRWAATELRSSGKMVAAEISERGIWELT